jgi:hypothetical protein
MRRGFTPHLFYITIAVFDPLLVENYDYFIR